MLYNIQIQYSSFELCPSCNRYTNTKTLFRKPAVLPSSGKDTPNLLNPLGRAILSITGALTSECKLLRTELVRWHVITRKFYRKIIERADQVCS